MQEIQAPVRLSQSRLWRLNEEFYEQQGEGAWTNEIVPTRIASNPMIAQAYAEVIAGYLRDAARMLGQDRRVTIVELGAGSGQFSYQLLGALERTTQLIAENAAICSYDYAMTDIARSNIAAWMQNADLQRYRDAGVLDFAFMDVTAPDEAHSMTNGRSLAEIIGSGPTIVIANYVLDSLVCDAFRVQDHQLFEMRVGLSSDTPPDAPVTLKGLQFKTQAVPATLPYFGVPAFDDILRDYCGRLRSGNFLFPTAPLQFLDRMRSLSPDGLMVLAADKGCYDAANYEGSDSLEVVRTGAFSSTVNFDAIARWSQAAGGHMKVSANPIERFDVVAIVLGETGRKGETELAFQRHIANMGPNFLHWLTTAIVEASPRLAPRAVLALLEASRHDPTIIVRMAPAVVAAANQAEPSERERLAWSLQRCLANYFALGRQNDPYFALGKIYQEMKDCRTAAGMFAKAAADRSIVAYNLALCHSELGEREEASAYLKESLDSRMREVESRRA